ncbi:chordin-like protein 2 [Elgaria multicarinata webbii]|uniref:chordin-like protein 2 n=1 Tax=Elgaria multicarinata webbii TaxID=159646 RepID=UPI002FCCC699
MAVPRRAVLLLLGCLLLCFAMETDASTNDSCQFNGLTYRTGQIWYPSLKPAAVTHCVRCICSQELGTKCYQFDCPPLKCRKPIKVPYRCCMVCPDVQTSPGLQAPDNFSCQYNDTTYQHGDIFTNSELFPSRESNQCSQCSCSEGHIYCGLVTCADLLCASPETVPDSCCQVCRDNSQESLIEDTQLTRGVRHSLQQCSEDTEETDALGLVDPPTGVPPELVRPRGRGGTTVRIILEENPRRTCLYNGKTYSHGEVWHPTVQQRVSVPCILCTCKDGVNDCQKVTCPTVYPCEQPQNVQGKCCKVCPEDKGPITEVIDISKCRVSVYMFVPSSSSTQHRKQVLRKIAVERESSEDVEIYIWKPMRGIYHLVQVKRVKKQDFRQQVQNFRLVSRTNEAYWNMFLVQGPEVKATESPDKETTNL